MYFKEKGRKLQNISKKRRLIQQKMTSLLHKHLRKPKKMSHTVNKLLIHNQRKGYSNMMALVKKLHKPEGLYQDTEVSDFRVRGLA